MIGLFDLLANMFRHERGPNKVIFGLPHPFHKDPVRPRDKVLTQAELAWLQVGSSEL